MMKSISVGSVRDFVSSWLMSNAEVLGLSRVKLERAQAPAEILSAWYESPDFFVDVAAWEHAFCLDIQVMNKKTNEFIFSACGACEDFDGIAERLSSFGKWITANRSARVV